MPGFTSSLKTEWLPDGKTWKVIETFRFYSGDYGSGLFVEVPEGTITDLASIPKLVRWLIPKVGKDAQGAVCHDVMYRTGCMSIQRANSLTGSVSNEAVPISRGMADSMYHQAMIALGVSTARRKAIYYGLIVGGWVAWNNHRNRNPGTGTATTQ